VVGVLVEVPVMLTLVKIANATRAQVCARHECALPTVEAAVEQVAITPEDL
jgi:hypothetical protein